MALIPRTFLDSVVALGLPDSKGGIKFAATGFLCGHKPGTDATRQKGYWVFLVTNRHVVANKTELMIRFNGPMDATPKTYLLPAANAAEAGHWTFHPDSNVDVAVLVVDAIGESFKGIQLSFMTPVQIGSVDMLRHRIQRRQ